MKKLLLLSTILCSLYLKAQIKERSPFFIGMLSTTFGINEDYTFDNRDSELFIIPTSILVRTEFGYQFDKRWATSINLGYDHHFRHSINAIPTYGSLRYNFISKSSSATFIEASYGKMWRPSDAFENGAYYKIGLGILSISDNRWNGVVKLDFHRKKINKFRNGNLDSVSIGIGFSFF